MKVTNLLSISDEEFLANSIRCWQESLALFMRFALPEASTLVR